MEGEEYGHVLVLSDLFSLTSISRESAQGGSRDGCVSRVCHWIQFHLEQSLDELCGVHDFESNVSLHIIIEEIDYNSISFKANRVR